MLTLDKLKKIIPLNKEVEEWYPILDKYLNDWDINTLERIAMFLAQCSHESAQFTVIKENLNYSSQGLQKVFGKYFNKATADLYQRRPEMIANRVYANRMGNGDERSGDGWKFRGKGLIQLTGKNNHQDFADFLEISLDDCTEYLLTKEGAVHSACYFWKENQLNSFSDAHDVIGATRRINGGTNGLNERKENFEKFLKILKS